MGTLNDIRIEHIIPTDLVLEDNIRKNVDLTEDFIQTIRDYGVLLPIRVLRASNGTLYVRDGQRRTLAAIEAGLATVPAYIAATDDAPRIRMIEQLIANEHRTALTSRDRSAAYAALTLDGLSATDIAKHAGTTTKQVKLNLTLAKSKAALNALDSMPITLDTALLFAEFENDEMAISQLNETLTHNPRQIEHTAQRLRSDATRARLISESITRLTGEGFNAIESGTVDGISALHTLTNAAADATEQPSINEEEHANCPGHIATVNVWNGRDGATISWACSKANEFHQTKRGYNYQTPKASGPMTDAEKAERKRVIENNKAWDAAETVRGEWVKNLLNRKNLPADSARYVAYSIAVAYDQNDHKANALAHTLLSINQPTGYGKNSLEDYLDAHPTKAAQIALAVAISTAEAHLSRQSWRATHKISRRYFQQLNTWGYTLSPVENIVAGYATSIESGNAATAEN